MNICFPNDPCLSCRIGFHNECDVSWSPDDTSLCGCGGKEVQFTSDGFVKAPKDSGEPGAGSDAGYVEDGYEGYKDISEYKDPLSTGRKRAASMYPIETGMVCEWAGLKNAGGGVVPIVGCLGRPASDRHHGPDKNTMNNAPDNMHRICDFCHNTWHGINDPHYGPRPDHTLPFTPKGKFGEDWFAHDSVTKATTDELIAAEKQRIEAAQK
jgi:hypothetical protein